MYNFNFSIGCDPELFVADTIPRSVIGKVGGTKARPLPLPIGEGFAVQEDNVALEFNIPPSHSKAEFVSNLVKATRYLEQQICAPYGWKFDKRSAISFAMEELEDERAFIFGCEPDFNAWTGRVNPRPMAEDIALRSAGGHVHIGCSHLDVKPRGVVRACDLYLGVPSVLMDEGELRKQLYGKAGAYRKKEFGVEYRTLSNFWVFSEQLIGWVYDNTERALAAALDEKPIIKDRDLILQAINKNDKAAAKLLVDKYNLEVV
jgi:Phage phiEco32-like COOH.NH2 ligase-type 2